MPIDNLKRIEGICKKFHEIASAFDVDNAAHQSIAKEYLVLHDGAKEILHNTEPKLMTFNLHEDRVTCISMEMDPLMHRSMLLDKNFERIRYTFDPTVFEHRLIVRDYMDQLGHSMMEIVVPYSVEGHAKKYTIIRGEEGHVKTSTAEKRHHELGKKDPAQAARAEFTVLTGGELDPAVRVREDNFRRSMTLKSRAAKSEAALAEGMREASLRIKPGPGSKLTDAQLDLVELIKDDVRSRYRRGELRPIDPKPVFTPSIESLQTTIATWDSTKQEQFQDFYRKAKDARSDKIVGIGRYDADFLQTQMRRFEASRSTPHRPSAGAGTSGSATTYTSLSEAHSSHHEIVIFNGAAALKYIGDAHNPVELVKGVIIDAGTLFLAAKASEYAIKQGADAPTARMIEFSTLIASNMAIGAAIGAFGGPGGAALGAGAAGAFTIINHGPAYLKAMAPNCKIPEYRMVLHGLSALSDFGGIITGAPVMAGVAEASRSIMSIPRPPLPSPEERSWVRTANHIVEMEAYRSHMEGAAAYGFLKGAATSVLDSLRSGVRQSGLALIAAAEAQNALPAPTRLLLQSLQLLTPSGQILNQLSADLRQRQTSESPSAQKPAAITRLLESPSRFGFETIIDAVGEMMSPVSPLLPLVKKIAPPSIFLRPDPSAAVRSHHREQEIKTAGHFTAQHHALNILGVSPKAIANLADLVGPRALGVLPADLALFSSHIAVTGLSQSYNNAMGHFPFYHPASISGSRQVGGVAIRNAGVLKDLTSTRTFTKINQVTLAVKIAQADLPFSQQQLMQVMAELAQGIYYYNTLPWVSEHFNHQGLLYSILHPVYQGTLVGEVVTLLDFMMKGYVNGGYYPKGFLASWRPDAADSADIVKLREHVIDLKATDTDFESLSELMDAQGLSREEGGYSVSSEAEYGMRFASAFRIIASMNQVLEHDGVLLADPGIEVEGDIEAMPDYKAYLESYQEMHEGRSPPSHEKLTIAYSNMAERIRTKMMTHPEFRHYFDRLKVITLIASYFTTLKALGMMPVIEPMASREPAITPALFPPIPIRHHKKFAVTLILKEVMERLRIYQHTPSVNEVLKAVLDSGKEDVACLTSAIESAVADVVFAQIRPVLAMQSLEKITDASKLDRKSIQPLVELLQSILVQTIKCIRTKPEGLIWQDRIADGLLIGKFEYEKTGEIITADTNLMTSDGISLQYGRSTLEVRGGGIDTAENNIEIVGGCGMALHDVRTSSLESTTPLLGLLKVVDSFSVVSDSDAHYAVLPVRVVASDGTLAGYQPIADSLPAVPKSARTPLDNLMTAAMIGNIKDIEAALSILPPGAVNARLTMGLTPLWLTIKYHHEAAALMLLSRPSTDFSVQLNNGENLLHEALEENQPVVAEALIEKGVNILQRRRADGMTPWHLAASAGCAKLLRKMRSRRADFDINFSIESKATAAHLAAAKGQYEVLEVLHELGADFTCQDKNKLTILMYAINGGQEKLALDLLKRGYIVPTAEDLLYADKKGCGKIRDYLRIKLPDVVLPTAVRTTTVLHARLTHHALAKQLHKAVITGNTDLCLALLNNGADPSVVDDNGYNAVDLAFVSCNFHLYSLLKEQCPLLFGQAERVIYHLMAAVQSDNAIALRDLASSDIDIRVTHPSERRNGLHYAAMHGATQCAEIMLHFSCDGLAEDVFGYSPLAYAAEKGHVGMIPILLSSGASVDCKNHAGETPLMLACKNGHVGAVTMLLRLGADSHKVTPMGKSVEAYANNNSAVLAALGFGESIREAATSETVGAALV